MAARVVAMVVWAAAAASAVFWGYRLLSKPPALPAQASVVEGSAPALGGDLARLFGAPAPVVLPPSEVTPPADARFKLLGVVAPAKGQRSGLALISVDGKEPRAYGIGGVVEGDIAVVSVSHRRVELGVRGAGATMALEIPALPEAARGTLDASSGAPAFVPQVSLPPPVGVAVPPAFPPRPSFRQGMPPGTAPTQVPGSAPHTPPQAPFGVTPQPAVPSGGSPGGPATG